MRVEKVHADTADVRAGDVSTTVGVQLIGRVRKGDYILVHAGLAIEKINRLRAEEIWHLITDLGHKLDERQK